MARTDRVYRIEMLIRSRRHVSFQQLLDDLEVSPATLKRDLAYLRDQLGAPIEYDRTLSEQVVDEDSADLTATRTAPLCCHAKGNIRAKSE